MGFGERTQSPAFRAALLLALMVALPLRALSDGESNLDAQVKASYMFNFVNFAEWPDDALKSGAPITVCVWGRADVLQWLEGMLAAKRIASHSLMARVASGLNDAQGCQALFVSGAPSKEMKQSLKDEKLAAVLTVGDDDAYGHPGALLNFKLERGRVAFSVNMETLSRSRVSLSSKLLRLAQPQ
jgi:hypothetical protein